MLITNKVQDIAQTLMKGNADSTLRHEENILYDEALVKVARARRTILNDFRMAGMIKPVSIGKTISRFERSSGMTGANISMDGRTAGEKDRVTFDEAGVPVPMVFKDFELGFRALDASRTTGEPLDTTNISEAGMEVMEDVERLIFNGETARGESVKVGNDTLYGLANHPNRNTVTGFHNWALDATTGQEITQEDTPKLLQAQYDDNFFGPFNMYVAKNIWARIQKDYSDDKPGTIKDRIEDYADINAVRPGDFLPNGNVILIQMTMNVADIVIGADLRNDQWMVTPYCTEFRVWTALAPRIKPDKNNNCGIVHATA